MRNRITLSIILLLFIGMIACSEKAKRNDQLKKEVVEWVGRQIHFPSDMTFMRYALDTVPFDIHSRSQEYKILIYTGSIGCTTCNVKLAEWIKMMALTDSVAPGKVSYLFFLDNGKMNDIRHMLKQTGLELPVCIDNNSLLNQLNQFSENPLFHTFLLDKDNQVLVVGNPTSSPDMRELYMQQITGNAPAPQSSMQTTATFEPVEINFGKFTMDQKQTTEFNGYSHIRWRAKIQYIWKRNTKQSV